MLIVKAKFLGKSYGDYLNSKIYELLVDEVKFDRLNFTEAVHYLQVINKNIGAESRVLYSNANSFLANWEIVDLKKISKSIYTKFEDSLYNSYIREININKILIN